MAKAGSFKHRQVICDINITPLTDIFLVLLTIMIVVAPFVRQMRPDLKLPEIASGADLDKQMVTVDVTKEGKFYIGNDEIPADRLATVLKDRGATKVVKKLIVQADRATKSGAVLQVFHAAEEAEYTEMTVAGQALDAKRESKPDETGAPPTVR